MALHTVPRITAQKDVLMTDPTKRLAEALYAELPKEWADELAASLTAQGYGHRDDHVRAFAEWLNAGLRAHHPHMMAFAAFDEAAENHLASLAAKPDAKEEDG